MQKRGQITIFIIVGILILAIILGMVYLGKYITKKELEVEEVPLHQVESVKLYVENCLKRTLDDGLLLIGQHGGYFILPNQSTEDAYLNTPYYFYQDAIIAPSIEMIQKEISQYIEDQLPFCLQNFQAFPFLIEFENPDAETNIAAQTVAANVLLPLKINLANQEIQINSFSSSVPSRLLQIYEVSHKINQLSMEYNPGICLDCVNQLAQESDLHLHLVEFKDDVIFFILEDEKVRINEEPFYFRFANKYNLTFEEFPYNVTELLNTTI